MYFGAAAIGASVYTASQTPAAPDIPTVNPIVDKTIQGTEEEVKAAELGGGNEDIKRKVKGKAQFQTELISDTTTGLIVEQKKPTGVQIG